MADEPSRRYMFVATDRATRWVFIHIYNSKTVSNAAAFCATWNGSAPDQDDPYGQWQRVH